MIQPKDYLEKNFNELYFYLQHEMLEGLIANIMTLYAIEVAKDIPSQEPEPIPLPEFLYEDGGRIHLSESCDSDVTEAYNEWLANNLLK
jgi:hypothetical protein